MSSLLIRRNIIKKRPKDIVKLYENDKQYGIVASTDKIEMTGLVKKGEENED